MAKTTENFLKILKDLCDKVGTEKDCTDAVASLKKQISILNNQTFFEYHTFSNFLEILATNQKIPTKNKNEIFKLLKSIVAKEYESCFAKLHFYLYSNKVSQ